MTQSDIPSGIRRWLIIITVMAATLLQVLDITIANVALPHMQAALGATPESIAWVLTSYVIMSAIATPITGWLETRFGRRNLFAVSIAGFTLSSAACGLATSIETMVAARALQGIFGAFVAPLAQATMLDSSPREKHPQALMIMSMGIMIGPIMGPVLGGWLTDNYGWRWVFYINIPVGILATIGILLLLRNDERRATSFDAIGFGLLALALSSLQLMLDRGAQKDWFEANEIIIEAGVAAACFWMFAVHVFTSKAPLLPLALLRDRNFTMASIFTSITMGIGMAGPALLAPMLQILLGYDTMGAGMLMMPRGVGALLAMPLVAWLGRKVDPRTLVATGLLLTALSLWMMAGFNLQMGPRLLVQASAIQGIGLSFCYLPLTLLAFSTLAPELRTVGAAFYNLFRNLGSSIGIAAVTALMAYNAQVNHAELGAHITSSSLPLLGPVGQLDVVNSAAMMVDREINRQALMIAYIDNFWLMMWVGFLTLPLLFFMRRTRVSDDAPMMAPE